MLAFLPLLCVSSFRDRYAECSGSGPSSLYVLLWYSHLSMANSITRELLLREAARRGWRTETIGPRAQLLKITSDTGRVEMFSGSRPMRSSANGRVISVFKNLTLSFVESLGYQVPAYTIIDNAASAQEFLAAHGRIVVKPIDGAQSMGVAINITEPVALAQAIQEAQRYSATGRVIVQKQIEGKLYRIFVLNGTVPVVTERRAAHVVGDGHATVRALVSKLNEDPRRGEGSDTPLKKVNSAAVESYLGSKGLERIPAEGEIVRVTDIESVSAGGEAVNVTDQAHPSWANAACEITKAMGLFIAGFDIICDDIAKPLQDKYLPLLEINSSPGLKIHEYPSVGAPVHLAPLIFDELLATNGMVNLGAYPSAIVRT